MPTVLDALQIPQPKAINGVAQQEINGLSFLPTLLKSNAPEYRTKQYFEMHGNRAIYKDGWIAVQGSGWLPWAYTFNSESQLPAWELYDLNNDYAQAKDLAGVQPKKLEELKKVFESEAQSNNVFPIDPRVAGRQHPNPPPPGGRPFYTFYPGATHLYDALAPGTRNRSHTFTAYVDIGTSGTNGVLVAEGGLAAGYTLYIKDGRPSYAYNYFRREVTTISGKDPLPGGKSVIELRFDYDGGGTGKGANVTLSVKWSEGRGGAIGTNGSAGLFV
jgi:hypothetical protein